MSAGLGRCYLCGACEARLLGAFVPDNPWLYCPSPPVPGNIRALFYSLCSACAAARAPEETAALVEAKALAEQTEVTP